jgi:PhzF family phenazine biosynthesis protein
VFGAFRRVLLPIDGLPGIARTPRIITREDEIRTSGVRSRPTSAVPERTEARPERPQRRASPLAPGAPPPLPTVRPVERAFTQVDVFTTTPYAGNPVAVVLDGTGLSSEEMQRFANWTNLSETTFVLPPTAAEADYLVRIFTPVLELPFAGHPTLGTCHAWLTVGGRTPKQPDVVVQECAAGLIEVRQLEHGLAFAAPPLRRSGPVEEEQLERIAAAFGVERAEILEAEWADNGPPWIALLFADSDAVLALKPTFIDLDIGVVGPRPDGAQEAFEVRAFFPKDGALVEDPVTGSFNASLAQWLLRTGRARAPYVARQGTALGRSGRVHISTDAGGAVWVGGGTIACITGKVEL